MMVRLILWIHLEEVLQTTVVMNCTCCVEQRAACVSQMDHGLDHLQIV